jgi:tetratricopeptide (TPR) repeat protein
VVADIEGQILNAEDQFFILMEAGHLITAIRGMGAPEARLCYERAEPLARSLKSRFLALVGQWRHSLNTGKLSAALLIAKRLYALAQEQNDSPLLIVACAVLASTLHFLGDFETSGQYAIRGVQVWRSLGARSSVVGIVDKAAVGVLCFKALFDAHMGDTTSSRATMSEAISLAEELKDMYSLAELLGFAASLDITERNFAEVERYASDLIELSTPYHFAHFLAAGSILRGWVLSAFGDIAEGTPWIEQGIRGVRAIGSVLNLPYYLALQAEALHLGGHTFEALEAIDEAEALAERFEQRNSLSRLNRLRGVFLAALGANETQIEASFSEAIRIAKEQKSVSLEKRAEATYAEYRRRKAIAPGGRGIRLPL